MITTNEDGTAQDGPQELPPTAFERAVTEVCAFSEGERAILIHRGKTLLQGTVREMRATYRKRRDALVESFGKTGWTIPVPQASMFAWVPIPERFRPLGSLEFAKLLIQETGVAVAPGVGFGEYGDDHVRFALIENESRTRQAIRGIRDMFRKDGLL